MVEKELPESSIGGDKSLFCDMECRGDMGLGGVDMLPLILTVCGTILDVSDINDDEEFPVNSRH